MEARRGALAVACVAALACAASAALQLRGPLPAADVARGTEDAFGVGLHVRELRGGQPLLRWTGTRTRFDFLGLPRGEAAIEVALHGNPQPVAVGVDGVLLAIVPAGGPGVTVAAPVRAARLRVETATTGFQAGGRQLGAMLDRVAVRPQARGVAAWPLLVIAVPAALVTLGALAAGCGAVAAVAAGAGAIGLALLLLGPSGLVFSPYAGELAILVSIAALLSLALARLVGRRVPGASGAAYVAALLAVSIPGLAAASPAMVVSDAVFHANKLGAVAAGDLFPTSITQHAQPFRFPYGVSFYAALAPLLRAGWSPVALVRNGAAVSAVLASLGLFLALVARGPWRAALAVALLPLEPAFFEPFSYGNLSNVFGQCVTVLFACWWWSGAPGGFVVGALLLAVAALGHFSSAVVVALLCAALVALDRDARRDRTRLLALALGAALAAAYYAHFVPLMLSQAPRLLEGGGQGRGPQPGALSTLAVQAWRALTGWGLPAVALALVGRPRLEDGRLARGLAAFLAAGAALFLLASVSPLDVRWAYALTLPVAVCAADGAVRLAARGAAGRATAAALLLLQAALGLRGVWEALWWRYR